MRCGHSGGNAGEWSSDAFPLTVYPSTFNHPVEQSTDLFLMKSTADHLEEESLFFSKDMLPSGAVHERGKGDTPHDEGADGDGNERGREANDVRQYLCSNGTVSFHEQITLRKEHEGNHDANKGCSKHTQQRCDWTLTLITVNKEGKEQNKGGQGVGCEKRVTKTDEGTVRHVTVEHKRNPAKNQREEQETSTQYHEAGPRFLFIHPRNLPLYELL